ncbi:hypothetical protein BIW11_02736 [Tropilaelaps mercedesae]|uniref:Uncharacterized protein n=1 Tax=Tropilaelaps mercedesae TaxID=418985 RepID=A0A1V9XY66_9ACAR|nr:hypothetical protein BIW11_02736 [Tropilaelaps mercedesae]
MDPPGKSTPHACGAYFRYSPYLALIEEINSYMRSWGKKNRLRQEEERNCLWKFLNSAFLLRNSFCYVGLAGTFMETSLACCCTPERCSSMSRPHSPPLSTDGDDHLSQLFKRPKLFYPGCHAEQYWTEDAETSSPVAFVYTFLPPGVTEQTAAWGVTRTGISSGWHDRDNSVIPSATA